jgi:hypothetical protein
MRRGATDSCMDVSYPPSSIVRITASQASSRVWLLTRSVSRACDRHTIDTLDQQSLVALGVLDTRLCWTFLLLQGLMVVTCV